MKKRYNSPITEYISIVKSSILCASSDGNGMLDGQGGGNKDGDANAAPKRRLF